MKKAQIEMVGLLIVIVLLSLIFIFALRLILRDSPDTLEAQEKSIKAQATLDALMNAHEAINVEEDLDPLRDKLKSCFQLDCNYELDVIESILTNMLGSKNFEFTIDGQSGSYKRPSNQQFSCSKTTVGTRIISSNPQITAKLKLCSA